MNLIVKLPNIICNSIWIPLSKNTVWHWYFPVGLPLIFFLKAKVKCSVWFDNFYLVWCSFTKTGDSLGWADSESEWWVISNMNTFMTGTIVRKHSACSLSSLSVLSQRSRSPKQQHTQETILSWWVSLALSSIWPFWTRSINLSLALMFIYSIT